MSRRRRSDGSGGGGGGSNSSNNNAAAAAACVVVAIVVTTAMTLAVIGAAAAATTSTLLSTDIARLNAKAIEAWPDHAWVSWEHDTSAQTITVLVRAKSLGWIGMGWHHDEVQDEMKGTDLFMAFMDSERGLVLEDMHAPLNGAPVLDSDCSGCGNQYLNSYGETNATSGVTTVAFVRSVKAPDKMDLDLGGGWRRVILAHEPGDSGDFSVSHSKTSRQDHIWLDFSVDVSDAAVCDSGRFRECRPDRSPRGQSGTPHSSKTPPPTFECASGGGGGDDKSKSGGGSNAIVIIVLLLLAVGGGLAGLEFHRRQKRKRYLRMTQAFALDGAFDSDEILKDVTADI